MQALFLMIVDGFAKLLSFFDKWRIFQNAETAFKGARFITRKTMLLVLVSITLAYFTLLIAFTYFMFESITSAFNLVSKLLRMIESGSTSGTSGGGLDDVMSTFYYMLNVTGITTGLNAGFPFFASAITFRLLKAVKTVFLTLYDRFKSSVSDLILLITSA